MTLMWAYALLTVLRATQLPKKEAPKKTLSQRTPSSLAALVTDRVASEGRAGREVGTSR